MHSVKLEVLGLMGFSFKSATKFKSQLFHVLKLPWSQKVASVCLLSSVCHSIERHEKWQKIMVWGFFPVLV